MCYHYCYLRQVLSFTRLSYKCTSYQSGEGECNAGLLDTLILCCIGFSHCVRFESVCVCVSLCVCVCLYVSVGGCMYVSVGVGVGVDVCVGGCGCVCGWVCLTNFKVKWNIVFFKCSKEE